MRLWRQITLEDERTWVFHADLWFLQRRDLEADAPRDDLRVCVGRLQHQVLTLRCQLRDQASAHRELQVSHGEASRLRDQLKREVGGTRASFPACKCNVPRLQGVLRIEETIGQDATIPSGLLVFIHCLKQRAAWGRNLSTQLTSVSPNGGDTRYGFLESLTGCHMLHK